MFEITANATLEGRKLRVTASGSTNAMGFDYDESTHGTTLFIHVKLTKPTKNDPKCACSGCGCPTPNPASGLDATIDVPEGITRVVVKVPLEGTIADFDL